ncbi:PQQ-binding-like beta-propeller repeat protein [Actinophytocola sp.]|uniref:outer membrane protein assembly factor BamB family protein n=1 Tax=Actinophytocola sp. TaxID=1872138 RepID=UPI002ED2F880
MDDSDGDRPRNPHHVALRRATGLLLAAVPILAVLGAVMTVNEFSCSSYPSLPICSKGMQALVSVLPACGAAAGVLVCLVAGGLAVRHQRTPHPWIALALVPPVASVMVAFGLASTGVRSADATTAADTRPAPVPAAPRTRTWMWHAPEGLTVHEVVPAGAGVVVEVEDGVIALDGVTGRERWRYRVAGANVGLAAVTPDGDTLTLNIVPRESGDEIRVLVLDATTGTVILDKTGDPWSFVDSYSSRVLTDHVLVGVAEPVRAFDPRTGEPRWEYTPPAECKVWDEQPPAMAGAGVVTVGMVCGPDKPPVRIPSNPEPVTVTVVGLDERTGQQRWQHTRDGVLVAKLVPAGDGSAVFLQCDGFGALLDPATGATVLDAPGTDADRVIGATNEWLATTSGDTTTYTLTRPDSGPITLRLPGGFREAATATDARVYALLANGDDDLTVITQPWTGADRSTVKVPRPDEQDTDLKEVEHDLVPAPGAIVIFKPDGTTVTGVG